jgi:hypothetical protein
MALKRAIPQLVEKNRKTRWVIPAFYVPLMRTGDPATESPGLGGFLVMEMQGREVVSMKKIMLQRV